MLKVSRKTRTLIHHHLPRNLKEIPEHLHPLQLGIGVGLQLAQNEEGKQECLGVVVEVVVGESSKFKMAVNTITSNLTLCFNVLD